MTVHEAINNIHAPKGLTSILAGISTGDFSVLPHKNGLNADYEKAKEMVVKHTKQLNECTSDWSYWSVLGDLSYWEAIQNILEAATIVGENNLPDIPKPDMEGLVVMDSISCVERYGKAILNAVKDK